GCQRDIEVQTHWARGYRRSADQEYGAKGLSYGEFDDVAGGQCLVTGGVRWRQQDRIGCQMPGHEGEIEGAEGPAGDELIRRPRTGSPALEDPRVGSWRHGLGTGRSHHGRRLGGYGRFS